MLQRSIVLLNSDFKYISCPYIFFSLLNLLTLNYMTIYPNMDIY